MISTRRGFISAGMVYGWLLGAASASAADVHLQASVPIAGQSWTVPVAPNAEIGLAWIPPGTFMMGSLPNEPGRKADESPQTEVTLSQGFWLGKNFVTIGVWKAVMGTGVRDHLIKKISDDTVHDLAGKKTNLRDLMHWSPAADPATYLANETDDLPMYFVSWDDAKEFCAKLNERELAAGRLPDGYAFDLPTEAQWEYACRAGSTEATYVGPSDDSSLKQIAWYAANSAENYQGRALGPTRSGPRAVGQKQPNSHGIYDMYGNLWQWCRDWYGPYPVGDLIDPVGPATGSEKVNRGGSWGSA